jgi:O-antigen/teichoic acid export membrane protein
MGLIHRLRTLIKTDSATVSTAIVGAGDLLVKIITLGVTISLMRAFNPAEYGIITTMLTMMAIVPIMLDFGTTPSVIRFGPFLEAKGLLSRRNLLFQSIFRLRLWLSGGLLLLIVPFTPYLAGILLHDRKYYPVVIMALVGSVGTCFMQFLIGVFQAGERYVPMTVVKVLEAVFKLVLVTILIFLFASDNPAHAILVYAVSPFLVLIFLTKHLKPFTRRETVDYSILKTLFSFSFWYMSANIFLMLFMNFDVLIIAALRPAEDVGYFGAGYRLAAILFLIVNAIFTVMVPKASKKTDIKQLTAFIRKATGVCFLVAVFMIPFTFLGPWLIELVAGPGYLQAEDVFLLIAWDHIVMVLFVPFMVTIFTINRPRVLALFAALEMVLNIVGDLIAVPLYGPAGAAAVTLLTRLTAGSAGCLYLWWKFRTVPGYLREIF